MWRVARCGSCGSGAVDNVRTIENQIENHSTIDICCSRDQLGPYYYKFVIGLCCRTPWIVYSSACSPVIAYSESAVGLSPGDSTLVSFNPVIAGRPFQYREKDD